MNKNNRTLLIIGLIILGLYLYKSGFLASVFQEQQFDLDTIQFNDMFKQHVEINGCEGINPCWSPQCGGTNNQPIYCLSVAYPVDILSLNNHQCNLNLLGYTMNWMCKDSSAQNAPGTIFILDITEPNGESAISDHRCWANGPEDCLSSGSYPGPNPTPLSFEDENLKVNGDCGGITIDPKFIRNSLSQKFIYKRGGYYQGLNLTNNITIEITSTYSQSFPARLWVWIDKPSGLTGEERVLYDATKDIQIEPGTKNYDITFPNTFVIGEYKIHSIITSMSMQVGCQLNSQGESLTGPTITYVKLSSQLNSKFLINPKPIYINVNEGSSCPETYEFQKSPDGTIISNTLCIRQDLKDIPCFTLGCPVTIDYTYECTSAGICAETIYRALNCTTDIECGTGLKCENITGVCYMEKIYDTIFQCDTVNDCARPCVGISIACNNHKCEYNGTCEPKKITCTSTGCAEGFKCINDVCMQSDNTTDYETSSIPWYIIAGLVLVIIFILYRKKVF
jgi:hypothetical protein